MYPNAAAQEEMARAKWSQAPDDDAAAMYLTAMERLEGAGYAQYEISNVARPAASPEQPQILDRWRVAWLRLRGALDTAAASAGRMCPRLKLFHRISGGQSTVVEPRRLSVDERLGDALFTGLRLAEGTRPRSHQRALRSGRLQRMAPTSTLPGRRFNAPRGTRLWLTRPGIAPGHEVMTVFVYPKYVRVTNLQGGSDVRITVPATGARLRWMAVGLVVGTLSVTAAHAQQPAAPAGQAQTVSNPRLFPNDAGMVLNFIKPDKTADFEAVMAKLKEALQKSEKPERKEQAAGWKVFKSADPAGANVLYVFIIDPAVKGADYQVSNIISEAFPTEANEMLKKYAEAYAQGMNILNLNLLQNLGK